MKKLLFFVMGSCFICFLFLMGGCNVGSSGLSYKEYTIQVDSIQAPDTITLGDTLIVRFYGTIGDDGCYSFSRFVGGVTDRNIDVTVLGKYAMGQNACPSGMQYLNGVGLKVDPVSPGPNIIHVHESTPPDIYDTVFIMPKLISKAR